MRRFFSLFSISAVTVLFAQTVSAQVPTDRRNSIVAEVNNKIITRHMVDLAMRREASLLRSQYAVRQPRLFGQKYIQLQADTLEGLIRR